jgi:hypothetical protein
MEDHKDEDCSPTEVAERRSDERASQNKVVEIVEISEIDQEKENFERYPPMSHKRTGHTSTNR